LGPAPIGGSGPIKSELAVSEAQEDEGHAHGVEGEQHQGEGAHTRRPEAEVEAKNALRLWGADFAAGLRSSATAAMDSLPKL
jgi:hypothetical protein